MVIGLLRGIVAMNLKALLVRPWLTLLLVVLVLITRTNYSSAIVDTPDISLAAFFIAGLWIPSALAFGLLFIAAALADQLSFMAGVSDWCFTPAYVFLVPTYACLWYAGYLCRNTDFFRIAGAAKVAVYFVLSVVAAYLISSYSFYYFSGRLSPTTAQQYTQALMHYFWSPYFSWAAVYTALALGIASVVRLVVANSAKSTKH
jgi:hypothetical protein